MRPKLSSMKFFRYIPNIQLFTIDDTIRFDR